WLVTQTQKEREKALSNCAGAFGNSNNDRQGAGPHFPFLHSAAWAPLNSPRWAARSKHGPGNPGQYCPVGHRYPHQRGPERQNCVDAYPTFLVVLWSAGLLCSQVPAAFAGLMYLFVRQKYFVGYLGERTQSTPGYIFGKRIILFLVLMSVAGICNYYLILCFGSDFENYIKTITTTISPLLLIP
uniref:Arachidonate 5-lipoxygenase-activating protein n=1 Tax=Rhinolophus ferrumequinum TaxID=59479 RepID=A0A671DMU6_RHIFE